MKVDGPVAVFGATGFIGSRVVEHLGREGVRTIRFSRRPRTGDEAWRSSAGIPDLGGAGAVINLAGESIAKRWTGAAWERIVASRVGLTEAIVQGIEAGFI